MDKDCTDATDQGLSPVSIHSSIEIQKKPVDDRKGKRALATRTTAAQQNYGSHGKQISLTHQITSLSQLQKIKIQQEDEDSDEANRYTIEHVSRPPADQYLSSSKCAQSPKMQIIIKRRLSPQKGADGSREGVQPPCFSELYHL